MARRVLVFALLAACAAYAATTAACADAGQGAVAPVRSASPASPASPASQPAQPAQPAPATPLVAIPAGSFRSLFPGKETPAVAVAAFALEAHAVTNAQFLAFVAADAEWRRSRVRRVFAEEGYLRHWRSDLDPGEGNADRPVTHVSWFAARAYARWRGRRLPTVAEWERAAGEGFAREAMQRILAWYAVPAAELPGPVGSAPANALGVSDLHGLVWEWTEDFNSALVTGESRGDSALERSLFCGSGALGAADPSDYAAFMRYAFRSSLRASYCVKNLGFRCAGGGHE